MVETDMVGESSMLVRVEEGDIQSSWSEDLDFDYVLVKSKSQKKHERKKMCFSFCCLVRDMLCLGF